MTERKRALLPQVALIESEGGSSLDRRGPNPEATVRVRYIVRNYSGEIVDGSGDTPVSYAPRHR